MKKRSKYDIVRSYLSAFNKKAIDLVNSESEVLKLEEAIDAKGCELPMAQIRLVLSAEAYKEKEEYLSKILKSKAPGNFPWAHLITDQDPILTQAVLDHWMWQVKRKMAKLPVYHHLMPVLSGPQGSGKSTLIDNIITQFEYWVATRTSLDQIADHRTQPGIAETYIVFCDELQGASKTDMDSLKHFITSPTVDYRPMATNDLARKTNNCTLIGATNCSLPDMIRDSTGMRRFYEIITLDKLDWDKLNAFPWKAWIKSIDETQESPIMPHLHELKAKQKELVRDSVKEWVESGFNLPELRGGYLASVLYADFDKFCKIHGFKEKISARKLAFKLEEMGWHKNHYREGSIWYPSYVADTVGVAQASRQVPRIPAHPEAPGEACNTCDTYFDVDKESYDMRIYVDDEKTTTNATSVTGASGSHQKRDTVTQQVPQETDASHQDAFDDMPSPFKKPAPASVPNNPNDFVTW